ncbi:MAG: aspartate carbamoyltransferase regulatory subunit [Nanoarchaeota archaeon]|nr:aspartate carbamoyltransferase regulatory subunit [Nanoarchaeota archaeon]MBU1005437.1 aspartate carbamoyltransferase regulatory subunit [Nanoarchaeota archaeon]MBU1945446.1 aspartate carbamoyltransferase regulatory subunit [Nanoarchaeota archaeon]
MKQAIKKELKVPAIKEGTVIDHIPSRVTFKVMRILDLKEFEHPISVALNLKSKSMGHKGIIKVGSRFLTEDEVNKIAILAPNATVNIIKGYGVKEKINVQLPDKVINIIKCSNPNCITNQEKVKTHFSIINKAPLKVICRHCERVMEESDITLI